MADTLEKAVIKEICATGDKTSTIPETTQSGSNALSYADGFPIATSTPQSDGGIPPKRTDMNKVLNMMSKNLEFLQNGGSYTFDSSVATKIGGYPKGARLLFKEGMYEYYIESLKNNNTTEPTTENILYTTEILQVKAIIENTSQLPTASEDTTEDIYICLADGKMYLTLVDRSTTPETYSWTGYSVSSSSMIYTRDTNEYWVAENSSFTNLNTLYSWVKIKDVPSVPMPDYSSGSSITTDVEQTATDNILVIVNLTGQDRQTPAQFFIGATVGATANVEIARWHINGASSNATWVIPIPKGYKYKIVKANITVTATKYIIR